MALCWLCTWSHTRRYVLLSNPFLPGDEYTIEYHLDAALTADAAAMITEDNNDPIKTIRFSITGCVYNIYLTGCVQLSHLRMQNRLH